MNKIPVGQTIERAYSFGFSNILSIFGIAWFPSVLLAVVVVGVLYYAHPNFLHSMTLGEDDPTRAIRTAPLFLLQGIFSLLVVSMVTVGIQRKALGKHPGPVFVYFSLGGAVWRMALTFFLAWLVVVLIIALTAGATIAIWFAAGNYVPQFAWLIRTLAIIVACLWVIYMVVRLTFFLPSVVVAEETIGLGRAWELAGGNFWRIVIAAIAVILPAMIAFGIVWMVLFGSTVFSLLQSIHPGMDPNQLQNMFLRTAFAIGPYAIAFQIVQRIVLLGLGNGLVANAYLAVTGSSGSGSSES